MRLIALIGLIMLSISSLSVFANDEMEKKVDGINSEIEKIKNLQKTAPEPSIYNEYLGNLEKEKEKYEKLNKKITKEEKKSSKKKVIPDSLERKIYPRVLQNSIAKRDEYKKTNLKLNDRYQLVVEELASSTEVLNKFNSLSEDEKKKFQEFIKSGRKKISELEQLKLELELQKIEAEKSEFSDMKKTGMRVGVMFDLNYQWNLNQPSKGRADADIPFKNYNTKHNDFTVQLAEINFMKSYKNIDLYMDIDFGEMPEQNRSVAGDAITHHLGQAFLRYKFTDFENTTLTAGKFYTHFGYEVAKSIENKSYSRPFYYNLVCPFWHEGVSLTKSGLGDFGMGFYIYDRSDRRVENNTGKTYGYQLNYASGNFTALYNLISGSEGNSSDVGTEGNMKTQHEIILTYALSNKTSFIIDALKGSNKKFDAGTNKNQDWEGVVGYVDQKWSNRNAVTLRGEYFADKSKPEVVNNLFSTTTHSARPTTVQGYTLTNRYTMDNGSEIRFEYRVDFATEAIFPKNKTDYAKEQNTATLAWLVSI